jgi:triosephosphate isomerase
MKKLIAGNWKMNGSVASNVALVRTLLGSSADWKCAVVVCVPAPYLGQVKSLVDGSSIELGAQDVSQH